MRIHPGLGLLVLLGIFATMVTLASCNDSPPRPQVQIELPPHCYREANIQIQIRGTIDEPVLSHLLTPEARARGIIIYSSTQNNGFGSVAMEYYDSVHQCVVFAESISLQEYTMRIGMDPVGISPFYKPGEPDNH